MDLAIDPKTRNRRDRATIRELLQMRACDKIPDTDASTRLIREGLIEKLCLEKQGGGGCPELLTSVAERKHRT